MDEKIGSRVYGRRNYVIATAVVNDKVGIRYAGTMGKAGYGILSCYLKTMVERKYRWFYYTYKKDYEAALATLKALGAVEKVWW